MTTTVGGQWRRPEGGNQRTAAAASGESGFRQKENRDRKAPGAGPQADSTGLYKDPQILQDFPDCRINLA